MKVNGKRTDGVPDSVLDLIVSMGYREDRIAVELNGRIVPRGEYPSTPLSDSDSVEIVGLVGGG